jgi:hypothetical protein
MFLTGIKIKSMGFQLTALMATTLFASISFYITFVEHPARMANDTSTALKQWRPSLIRAAGVQFAIIGIALLASIIAFSLGQPALVLFGGLTLSLVAPYTLIVIMPVNRILLNTNTHPATPGTRGLLERWGQLHLLRTIISSLSLAIQLFSL